MRTTKTIPFLGALTSCLMTMAIAATCAGNAHAENLVLVAADSRPTAYIENGRPTGVLVDVVSEAFRRAGYSVTIQLKPWARCLAEVREGNVDGIFSVFRLPEREAFLAYSHEPIITQVEAFFAHADSDIGFDGDIAKLSNRSIGIILNTSYGDKIDGMLADGAWRNVYRANSVESLVSMLAAKRFDFAPSYRQVFIDAAKTINLADQIRELSPPVESVPSYLAFNRKRDYSKVIADFDKALTSMKEDKTFDAIYGKY